MFFKRDNAVKEATLQKLLETPAAKALLAEQEKHDDEAALARRVPILYAMDVHESAMAAARASVTELAQQEHDLLVQLDEVRRARTQKSGEYTQADYEFVLAERALRNLHGERHVLEAELLCTSTYRHLEDERTRIARVPSLVRDPGVHPENWMAKIVSNPDRENADARIATINSQLLKVDEARKALRQLRRARLAPRELECRCTDILSRAGVVRVVHEQWEGTDLLPAPQGPMALPPSQQLNERPVASELQRVHKMLTVRRMCAHRADGGLRLPSEIERRAHHARTLTEQTANPKELPLSGNARAAVRYLREVHTPDAVTKMAPSAALTAAGYESLAGIAHHEAMQADAPAAVGATVEDLLADDEHEIANYRLPQGAWRGWGEANYALKRGDFDAARADYEAQGAQMPAFAIDADQMRTRPG